MVYFHIFFIMAEDKINESPKPAISKKKEVKINLRSETYDVLSNDTDDETKPEESDRKIMLNYYQELVGKKLKLKRKIKFMFTAISHLHRQRKGEDSFSTMPDDEINFYSQEYKKNVERLYDLLNESARLRDKMKFEVEKMKIELEGVKGMKMDISNGEENLIFFLTFIANFNFN